MDAPEVPVGFLFVNGIGVFLRSVRERLEGGAQPCLHERSILGARVMARRQIGQEQLKQEADPGRHSGSLDAILAPIDLE